jgi:hypothetical protein|tara:strand:- start:1499 stop:1705 length:207 start_codon:yes stop_codon:yes gene_type:complete
MEVWVLHLVIMFVNGQVFMLEHKDRFETRQECMIQGAEKSVKMVENVMLISGIPAISRFNCEQDGVEI